MLYHDFLSHTGNEVSKWLHYFPVYESYFAKYVNQSVVFLEIGVSKGGSLQMWSQYFGPFAKIIGIDIDPKCKAFEDSNISVCIGDQSDTDFLQWVIEEYGTPDIVLDDGSHMMKHVVKTFDFLYEKISKNGVYIIEDLHTAYYDSFGGGLGRKSSFVEYCKELIDLLNARHWNGDLAFAKSTYSLSFYDSMAVLKKTEWPSCGLKQLVRPTPEWWHIQKLNPYDTEELQRNLKNKTILLFGSGEYGKLALEKIEALKFQISYFIDNDPLKHNKIVNNIKVLSPHESLSVTNSVYLITIADKGVVLEVYNQLLNLRVLLCNIFHLYIY